MSSTNAEFALKDTSEFASVAEAIDDANNFDKYDDLEDFFCFFINSALISRLVCPEIGEALNTFKINGLEVTMDVKKGEQRFFNITGDSKGDVDAVLDEVAKGLKTTDTFKDVKVRNEKVPVLSDPDTFVAAIERGFADLFGLPTRGACATIWRETEAGPQVMIPTRALDKAYGGYYDWSVGGGATTNTDGSIMTGQQAILEEMEQELSLILGPGVELVARSVIYFRRRFTKEDLPMKGDPETRKLVRCFQLGSMYAFTIKIGPNVQLKKDGKEVIGIDWFSFSDAEKIICSKRLKPAAVLGKSDFLRSAGQLSADNVRALEGLRKPADDITFPRDILDFQAGLEGKYKDEPESFFTKIPGFTPPYPF